MKSLSSFVSKDRIVFSMCSLNSVRVSPIRKKLNYIISLISLQTKTYKNKTFLVQRYMYLYNTLN